MKPSGNPRTLASSATRITGWQSGKGLPSGQLAVIFSTPSPSHTTISIGSYFLFLTSRSGCRKSMHALEFGCGTRRNVNMRPLRYLFVLLVLAGPGRLAAAELFPLGDGLLPTLAETPSPDEVDPVNPLDLGSSFPAAEQVTDQEPCCWDTL